MRPILVLTLLFVAGCAGQPSTPPAPAQAVTYVSSTGAPVAQISATAATGADLDAKRLADAKKAGYTVINSNGEPLFCSTEPHLGSHVQKDTICLTAKQWDDERVRTQQGLQNYMRSDPAKGGK
ncbi:MAG TPA: hypothetical protein VGI65_13750 [Steroidobacteraceae bacterium]|jgi:hypothetical protein